jgi:dephospho-CoA kinase
LFNQASQKKLQLTCPFDAYFFTQKRKWLNELKNQLIKVTLQEDFTSTTESTQVMLAETELFDEKQQLFDLMFQN